MPKGSKPVARRKLTRGERVIAFIERYCVVPEGKLVGKPMRLDVFQKKFILDTYDNPHGTSRAILSIARKNGKTGLIAGILLAHVAGPEARQNSSIVSGALSRDQAAIVFSLAAKMVRGSPELSQLVRIVPSSKRLLGLTMNTEFRALSADSKTAHGQSPTLAILDEVGQVRGPSSDFIDAIITAQGAHENPLLIAISTQAPNDNDLLSIWIDDARTSGDPRIVCHVYEATKDCDVMNEAEWRKANPALGNFRSEQDLRDQAERAVRMPSFEGTFRNLCLNQRVETISPFIAPGVWLLNSHEPNPEAFKQARVAVGLDLSARTDLTAAAIVADWDGRKHVRMLFWTPEKGLKDRAKRDRAPYDVWVKQGYIRATPGAAVDYEQVVSDLLEALSESDVAAIAFDRWRIDVFKKELARAEVELPLLPFGQGFKDMSPALEALEAELLEERIAHGNHPVLTMCAANARAEKDPAGNRKLTKGRATGRIDGLVALTMAIGVLGTETEDAAPPKQYQVMFF